MVHLNIFASEVNGDHVAEGYDWPGALRISPIGFGDQKGVSFVVSRFRTFSWATMIASGPQIALPQHGRNASVC
jgi:hypothetical protein